MGEGGPAHVDACGQGEGVKNGIFCGRHKWMAPYAIGPLCIIDFIMTSGMDAPGLTCA